MLMTLLFFSSGRKWLNDGGTHDGSFLDETPIISIYSPRYKVFGGWDGKKIDYHFFNK